MILAVETIKAEVEEFIKAKGGPIKLSLIEKKFGYDVSVIMKMLIDEGIVRNVYTRDYGWIYYYKG
jgi:hypothetical protein